MRKYIGWLLMLPLVAVCVIISCLAEPVRVAPAPRAFAPVVKQVEMQQVPSTSNVPGAVAYHIVVFVGYQGTKPKWWGQQEGVIRSRTATNIRGENGPQLLKPCFVDGSGHKYSWNPLLELPSLYNPKLQQYYVDLETEVSGDFQAKNCRISGTIEMGDGSTVKVFTPVALALQHPAGPSALTM